MRVLIIDRDSTSWHILKTYLDFWHCRVEEVDSAEGVMSKLQTVAAEGDSFKIAMFDHCILKLDVETLGRRIKDDSRLQDVRLVMLASVGKRGDAKHYRELGFDAYLVKPLKKSMLYDCFKIVIGKPVGIDKDASRQIVTRHSIAESRKKRASILVVEDNLINQKVAMRILDKKLGYHADVVSNGREAIDSLKRLDYDLVLMDCQMPEIDGYEATRIIRDVNSDVRNHRIPIEAMTANAMKGDREKCLESGMDDYITKPINVQNLAETIERNICVGEMQREKEVPKVN